MTDNISKMDPNYPRPGSVKPHDFGLARGEKDQERGTSSPNLGAASTEPRHAPDPLRHISEAVPGGPSQDDRGDDGVVKSSGWTGRA